ncbi:gamma-glutamylcyclotransferase [Nitratireductor sp. XY-223]|uniref:gamma-glutamylcyclotransferase n=1 Tax=Nitratireductor sp. XY-223 TaxID=2561926 RepID=UPI0010A9B5D2|nr:gamma-glutamylcyclotransferase [Nitratireductor sp. XY-223]
MDDFWVFGYGSLMWRPGFDFVEAARGRLFGYRRALCIYSWVHRGTRDKPGLVLGLDRGGSCTGMVFRVDGINRDRVMGYLRERELVTNVYLERTSPVHLSDGRRITAVCFVADQHHEQFAGHLTAEDAARRVAVSEGRSGHNVDYVASTVDHLKEMKIRDHWLEDVARLIGPPRL